jgi:hypothetical protein
MPVSYPRCSISGIPRRLHTRTRKAEPVPNDDHIFIRHESLPTGEAYHLEIPGHRKLENQSANSEELNRPWGVPTDVLYDTRYGRHERYAYWQIAKLPIAKILALDIPNPNTRVLNSDGTEKVDKLSFEVIQEPHPCMYPHCVIYAKKNGQRPHAVASGFKTAVRAEFARIAEMHRQEMLGYLRMPNESWKAKVRRFVLLLQYRAAHLIRA